MKQYLEGIRFIFENGAHKGDRTGTGTQSYFGTQERYNLKEGFPLVTTKFVDFDKIKAELKWFLEGSTDNNYLNELGTKIWNEWALREEDLDKQYVLSLNERIPDAWGDEQRIVTVENLEYDHSDLGNEFYALEDEVSEHAFLDRLGIPRTKTYRELGRKVGELGPIYGKQWRSWACPDGSTIDQIAEVIHLLKTKPDSRRLLVSAWNPADLPDESISPQDNVLNGKAALPACHTFFQLYSKESPLEEIIDRIFEDDLFEVFDDRLDEMRSHEMIDGWIPVEELGLVKGDGFRHPDYKRKVIEFAIEHKVPVRDLSCQVYIRSC